MGQPAVWGRRVCCCLMAPGFHLSGCPEGSPGAVSLVGVPDVRALARRGIGCTLSGRRGRRDLLTRPLLVLTDGKWLCDRCCSGETLGYPKAVVSRHRSVFLVTAGSTVWAQARDVASAVPRASKRMRWAMTRQRLWHPVRGAAARCLMAPVMFILFEVVLLFDCFFFFF